VKAALRIASCRPQEVMPSCARSTHAKGLGGEPRRNRINECSLDRLTPMLATIDPQRIYLSRGFQAHCSATAIAPLSYCTSRSKSLRGSRKFGPSQTIAQIHHGLIHLRLVPCPSGSAGRAAFSHKGTSSHHFGAGLGRPSSALPGLSPRSRPTDEQIGID
jgi:hypothetical protein